MDDRTEKPLRVLFKLRCFCPEATRVFGRTQHGDRFWSACDSEAPWECQRTSWKALESRSSYQAPTLSWRGTNRVSPWWGWMSARSHRRVHADGSWRFWTCRDLRGYSFACCDLRSDRCVTSDRIRDSSTCCSSRRYSSMSHLQLWFSTLHQPLVHFFPVKSLPHLCGADCRRWNHWEHCRNSDCARTGDRSRNSWCRGFTSSRWRVDWPVHIWIHQ